MSEVGIQDEGGDPNSAQVDSKPPTRGTGKSMLDPVQEMEFDDEFELTDEEKWVRKLILLKIYMYILFQVEVSVIFVPNSFQPELKQPTELLALSSNQSALRGKQLTKIK